MKARSSRLVAAAALAALLSACSIGASMQVDVEVYKGPLSKTALVQGEEFCSKVADAKRAVDAQLETLKIFAQYKPPRKPNFWKGRYKAACEPDCQQKEELRDDLEWAQAEITSVLYTSRSSTFCRAKPLDRDDGLREFAAFGAQLRDRANYWSAVELSDPPRNVYVRRYVNDFAIFAAEYGNQIVSRVDALVAQNEMSKKPNKKLYEAIAEAGAAQNGSTPAKPYPANLTDLLEQLTPAQRLATSVYLRDSNPTAYRNLHDWNRDPYGGGSVGEFSALDRVRMAEELMRDEYWSRINTVHASGMGETQMAFIKDDIGNWNLKSFSNDPTELLAAYNNLARAAVSEAIQLASTGGAGNAASAATKIGKADQLLSLSNRALIGEPRDGPTIGPAKLSEIRARVSKRLEDERARLATELDGEDQKGPRKLREAETVKKQEATNEMERAGSAIKTHQADIDKANIPGNVTSEENRATACAKVEAPPEDAGEPLSPTAKESCAKLKQEIGKRDAAKSTLAAADAAIADLDKKIAALEKSAVERARLILRDHAAVLGVLQEVMAPPAAAPHTKPSTTD